MEQLLWDLKHNHGTGPWQIWNTHLSIFILFFFYFLCFWVLIKKSLLISQADNSFLQCRILHSVTLEIRLYKRLRLDFGSSSVLGLPWERTKPISWAALWRDPCRDPGWFFLAIVGEDLRPPSSQRSKHGSGSSLLSLDMTAQPNLDAAMWETLST